MNADIFVIGDTHFGHTKILQFEPKARPFASIEAHDEALIANWNGVVKQNDTVIHLGDVVFGAKTFDLLSRLNGQKKLILGNHDRYPLARYLAHFQKVYGVFEYEDCLLTHVPISSTQFYRYRLNVHGHVHSNTLDDPRYVNASADVIGLRPVRLRTLIGRQ